MFGPFGSCVRGGRTIRTPYPATHLFPRGKTKQWNDKQQVCCLNSKWPGLPVWPIQVKKRYRIYIVTDTEMVQWCETCLFRAQGRYRPSSLTSSGTLFRSSGQMSGYYSDKVIDRSFPNNITNSGLREETSPRDFPTHTSQSLLVLSLSKAHVRSTVKSYENRMWLGSFAHSYYFIFYSKSNVMTCSSDERSGRSG
jgi:hypothetical protein